MIFERGVRNCFFLKCSSLKLVVGFRERSTKSILIQFGSLAKLNISVSGSRPAVLASTGAPHELQHAYKRTSHLESLVHS